MTKGIFRGRGLFALLLMVGGPAIGAELILTAPPRESVAAGQKLYQPLARHISKLIGSRVVYQHSRNWLYYQRQLRNNKYDIIFDEPHFISWRIAHLKHDVLVKLPGQLEYYLLGYKADKRLKSLDDLVGQKICSLPLPSLSALTILDRFRNPVRQPVIIGIQGGMDKVYQAFVDGKCKAVILRTSFVKQNLKQQQRNKLKIFFHSLPLPNQGISVSQRLSATAKNKILRSLILGNGSKAGHAILKRFGGIKARSFIPAKNRDYAGYNMLLEGVIFGW